MKTLTTLLILLSLIHLSEVHSSEKDNTPTLKKQQGYLLLDTELAGNGSKLHIAKGPKFKYDFKIDLSKYNSRFLILPLKSGTYKITRVEAPHYNLPYVYQTNETPSWKFNIEAHKVNYIGSLSIMNERESHTVDIHLKNRFATTINDIRSITKPYLDLFPLVSGHYYKDDYINELKIKNND